MSGGKDAMNERNKIKRFLRCNSMETKIDLKSFQLNIESNSLIIHDLEVHCSKLELMKLYISPDSLADM